MDSWFVLQETTFANLEPLDQKLPPHMPQPVEDLHWEDDGAASVAAQEEGRAGGQPARCECRTCSWRCRPAVLGPPAADILANMEPSAGGNHFLSSPKRYLWDQTPVGDLGQAGLTYWTMNVQRWHPNSKMVQAGKTLEKLSGTVLRFLDQDGSDWTPGRRRVAVPAARARQRGGAPALPPQRTGLSARGRAHLGRVGIAGSGLPPTPIAAGRPAGQPFVRVRLASVMVTFPPGWTAQELAAYRRKWQKALDIFALTHFADCRLVTDGGERPNLSMELDEAVAAQLPLVFDEMRRLGGEGENWLELVGRGHGTEARARVLNLDIGGGTTDVTIMEYQDRRPGEGVDLSGTVLYRDSSTIAGDALVRRDHRVGPAARAGARPERRGAARLSPRCLAAKKVRSALVGTGSHARFSCRSSMAGLPPPGGKNPLPSPRPHRGSCASTCSSSRSSTRSARARGCRRGYSTRTPP